MSAEKVSKLNYLIQSAKGKCIAGLILLYLALASCTYSEPESEIHFSAFLPDEQQLSLSPRDLPPSLSIGHHYPVALEPEKAKEYDALFEQYRPFKVLEGNKIHSNTFLTMTHDRLNFGDVTSGGMDLTDKFDPFYVGAGNREDNQTESNCGALVDGEQSQPILKWTGGAKNSTCLIAVIKIGLHRALTHYDNYHRVITAIVDNIQADNTAAGLVHEYINTKVTSNGSNGLRIRFFYDSCVNHRVLGSGADPGANSACTGESDNATYHRVQIYPLAVTNSSITTDSMIGKMEWLQRVNKSTKGSMVISGYLMTNTALGAPPQMQFDFAASASGDFQSITMKLPTQEVSSSYEFTYNSDVIRVTRKSQGSGPGLWTVEGSIYYYLHLGQNPRRTAPGTFEQFSHTSNERVYFVGVAEDVFTDGHALYKAIMANVDDSTSPIYLDTTIPSSPTADWDKEYHLWAAYKKKIMTEYTYDHYLTGHGMDQPAVQVWNTKTGFTINPDYQQHIRVNTGGNPLIDTSADGSRVVSANGGIFDFGQYPDLNVWQITLNSRGERVLQLEGSCQPFGVGGKVSNPSINKQNRNQVLVGNYGTNEPDSKIHLLDITNISSGICTPIATFSLPPLVIGTSTYYRNILKVALSPDGSKVAANTNQSPSFHIWEVATPTIKHREFSTTNWVKYSMQFNAMSSQLIIAGHGNRATIYDVANQSFLTLYDDRGPELNGTAIFSKHNAIQNPIHPNQILVAGGAGNYSGVIYPPELFRWDISTWNPALGDATWNMTTSPYLIQHFTTQLYNQNNTALNEGRVYKMDISPDGQRLVTQNGAAMTIFDVNQTNGAITETPIKSFWNTGAISGIKFVSGRTHLVAGAAVGGSISSMNLHNVSNEAPGTIAFRGDGFIDRSHYVEFTADNNYILSSDSDSHIRLWSLLTGYLNAKFSSHTAKVNRAMFIENETQILSASDDNSIKIWNSDPVSAGYQTEILNIAETAAVNFVDYDPVSKRIASASADGNVRIYNTSGGLLGTISNINGAIAVKHVDFSDDGNFLLASTGVLTGFIDMRAGSPTEYTNLGTINHSAYTVNNANFYPGSTALIHTSSSRNAQISVLDVSNMPIDGTFAVVPLTVNDFTCCGYSSGSQVSVLGPDLTALRVNNPMNTNGYSNYADRRVLDPSSPYFGQIMNSTIEPDGGAREYYDRSGPQRQDAAKLFYANYSPDGTKIAGSKNGTIYNPFWVDFEGWFNETSGGTRVRPDNRDYASKYYVSPITVTGNTNGDQAPCFIWSGRACAVLCSEVGGCSGYQTVSEYTYFRASTSPPTAFVRLQQELDALVAANPNTAGYLMDRYSPYAFPFQ